MKIENVLQIVDPSGLTYYLGTITPPQIMELTFIPCVVNVNSDVLVVRTSEGYQREGDKKRMLSIKDFYTKHLTSLIPPVLLSTRGAWRFTPTKGQANFGSIEASDCAAVVDGQHRLGGLSLLAQDDASPANAKARHIPFMAVEFDTVKVECDEFEVINGEQKGIKQSHLKYIRRSETFTGSAAYMLMEDDDSVFKGRIAIANRQDWDLITFQAASDLVNFTFDSYFCTNTQFRPGASEENQAKGMHIIQMYWKAVAQTFGVMWDDINQLPAVGVQKSVTYPGRSKLTYRLLEETGLRAVARLGSQILHKAWLTASGEIAWGTVDTLLTKVANDATVNLVMQKLKPHNKDEILKIDPRLQQQGKAGELPLYHILLGALDK